MKAKALLPANLTGPDGLHPSREVVLCALCGLLSIAFLGNFLIGIRAANSTPTGSAHATAKAVAARLQSASSLEPRATVSDIVSKALAFEATLSSDQLAIAQLTYTSTLARKWSNLPCTNTCRNGIGLGTLSATQLAAALAVIQAAEGTAANEGYDEFLQIRMADDVLAAAQGSGSGGPGGGGPGGGAGGYGSGNYYLAFLNTPSATGAWMMQFGGHHYAANISFNQGHIVATTPHFYGVEPTSFTVNGVTYAPVTQERDAMANMLASLTSDQLTAAKLSQTFSDAVMIPGATQGGTDTFPTPKVGIAASTLTAVQKALIFEAMKPWVRDMEDTVAANLLTIYQNELDSTYISWTGSGTSGNASSFLNANTNYARIDGPSVWIEFVCQNGVVFQNQIHYHTVWRDHVRDYAGDLSLTTPLDSGYSGGLTSTSAASYAASDLAPEAIGTLFGSGLATTTVSATDNPPPTTLGNVQVQIKDSTGTTRSAPIFYVSPTQISFQNPSGTSVGAATITVLQGGNTVATGSTLVDSVTPGLFSANASGSGVAASTAVRVNSDSTQTSLPVYQLDSSTKQFAAVPIDVSSGQVYLLLFGTGFRNASSLSSVSATINGVAATVAFAGAQGTFSGLDQANVLIPSSLARSGTVNVVLTVDGKVSNTVTITLQ